MNMALDEALLHSVAAGQSSPVLRLYTWSGPAVSLGYNQDYARELDPGRCRALGVRAVRRPTGGRSVYHSRELTYMLAGPGDTGALGRKIAETAGLIAGALRASLALLGLETDSRQPRDTAAGSLANPCFTSPSRFEITLGGRKLVGSAQRRLARGAAFLQQGSCLLHNDQPVLADLLPDSRPETEREELRAQLREKVTGIAEELGREPDSGELAQAFRQGFEGFFGRILADSRSTESELSLARTLERQRYSTTHWLVEKKDRPGQVLNQEMFTGRR